MVSSDVMADLLRDALASGQHPRLKIISGSMMPLLAIDDDVILESCTAKELEIGDIIVVNAHTALYTHRLCGKLLYEDIVHLVTRGDRPFAYDPLWKPEVLIGRVSGRIRSGQEISFKAGAGKRLNERLARIYEREVSLLGGASRHVSASSLADPHTRRLASEIRGLPLGETLLRFFRVPVWVLSRVLVGFTK